MPILRLPTRRLRRRPLRTAVAAVALVATAVGGAAVSTGSSGGYVVQPGDSLWRIAGRAGTTVSALAAANHMRPTDILVIGRHLVVPGPSTSTVRASSTSSTGASSSTAAYGGAGGPSGVVRSVFCAGYTPDAGPAHLPPLLLAHPSRLALRPVFVEWARHYGVSAALLEAIAWQESGWQQGVVSSAGAVGVGQVMPATAAFVVQQLDPAALSLQSTADNIRLEAAYVAYLTRHTATRCDTIAAYYEGLANLAKSGVFAMSVPYVNDVEYLVPGFS